jgi:hypothetical protein
MMKKIITATLITFFINSCGFEVIYREKENGISYEKELASIKIQKSAGILNQQIRYDLYDLFNPDSITVEPKYFLVIRTSEAIGSTFLTSTGASGRNKITLTTNYTLYRLSDGAKFASGVTSANDNYDIQENRFGTYTAEEFTKSNLTKILAQNLRNLLVNDIIEIEKRGNKPLVKKEELPKKTPLDKKDDSLKLNQN